MNSVFLGEMRKPQGIQTPVAITYLRAGIRHFIRLLKRMLPGTKPDYFCRVGAGLHQLFRCDRRTAAPSAIQGFFRFAPDMRC